MKQLQQKRNWYVIHTSAGYEENVANNLKQRIKSMRMENKIFNVIIPKEKKVKIRGGKRKIIEEKIYPGYVLVDMIVTDDSWNVVRNTPNVTGFLGAGIFPIPVSSEQMKSLQKRMDIKEPEYKVDFSINSLIKVTDGPFKGYDGKISEIDEKKGKIKVLLNIFNRETPVELDFLQVKKI